MSFAPGDMSSRRKAGYNDTYEMSKEANYPYGTPSSSRWNPKTWGKKTRIAVAVSAVVLLVVIIVGAVVGTKENAYPSYSKLNYQIKDTCMYLKAVAVEVTWLTCSPADQGTSFFDNFDYFTGYDPTQGFVQ